MKSTNSKLNLPLDKFGSSLNFFDQLEFIQLHCLLTPCQGQRLESLNALTTGKFMIDQGKQGPLHTQKRLLEILMSISVLEITPFHLIKRISKLHMESWHIVGGRTVIVIYTIVRRNTWLMVFREREET
ncbi:uncharacterized protein LOC111277048 [Durio zibethinus]|uniref:Uncharacterized protein LOC111277048 n=1 Tax=Durio zibethinus TaxID=66656 RepID=A0A6P5WS77_DURZI|nr:uncharacterized protein LOC111277048 [Durio zibethinus]